MPMFFPGNNQPSLFLQCYNSGKHPALLEGGIHGTRVDSHFNRRPGCYYGAFDYLEAKE
jgi:hypothetical protein